MAARMIDDGVLLHDDANESGITELFVFLSTDDPQAELESSDATSGPPRLSRWGHASDGWRRSARRRPAAANQCARSSRRSCVSAYARTAGLPQS